MLLGAFCAVACLLPHGQIAVQPDSTVTRYGQQIGWYVDNEDPTQPEDVARHVVEGWPVVIAGEAAFCRPCPSYPGAINAREWFPFFGSNGVFTYGPSPPRRSRAYIVQWDFAWPGYPPPTDHQRRALHRAAARRHPRLILRY